MNAQKTRKMKELQDLPSKQQLLSVVCRVQALQASHDTQKPIAHIQDFPA